MRERIRGETLEIVTCYIYYIQYKYRFILHVSNFFVEISCEKIGTPSGDNLYLAYLSLIKTKVLEPKNIVSKFTTTSDSYVGSITRGRSKEIQHSEKETDAIADRILKKMTEPMKERIVIK